VYQYAPCILYGVLKSIWETLMKKKNFKRVGNVTDVFWAFYGAFGESPWSVYEYWKPLRVNGKSMKCLRSVEILCSYFFDASTSFTFSRYLLRNLLKLAQVETCFNVRIPLGIFQRRFFSTMTEKRILLLDQNNRRIQDGKAARNAYLEWLNMIDWIQ